MDISGVHVLVDLAAQIYTSVLISQFHYLNWASINFAVSTLICGIVSVIAIYNAKKRLNNLYLYGVIDGLLLVQSILIIAAYWIHPI